MPAVRGDLIRILNKLLKRKEMFDAILIETTGLADPAPVIQTFFMDEEIKDACVLDAGRDMGAEVLSHKARLTGIVCQGQGHVCARMVSGGFCKQDSARAGGRR